LRNSDRSSTTLTRSSTTSFATIFAGADLKRHVRALAAENHERQPWRFPVGRGPQAPLIALRVDQDDLLSGVMELLDDPPHRVGLPGAPLRQHGERLRHDVDRQAQVFREFQGSNRHAAVLPNRSS
jgi:hypothetical protein